MIKTSDEILFEFVKKLAEVPEPEVPTDIAPVETKEEQEEHPVGSPEWLAQNYRREFLVSTTNRGWEQPQYDALRESTVLKMLNEKPENYFYWRLQRNPIFDKFDNIAAEKFIEKDPIGALLNYGFFTSLRSGSISVESAKKLRDAIIEKYNPVAWKNKEQGMLYKRFNELSGIVGDTSYTSTRPVELVAPDEEPKVDPEWISDNHPRVMFKDKAWQDKAHKRNAVGEKLRALRLEKATEIAVYDPKKYFNWEIHLTKSLSDAVDVNHPTAIAASNFIDTDPIGALLNKNFFNPMVQAEKVNGLKHGQLHLLWNKLIDNDKVQVRDAQDNIVEQIKFKNPVINSWFHNPPRTSGTADDIIGSQLGRLAKKIGIIASTEDIKELFNRTPETLKMIGPDTERETGWMNTIRDSVKDRVKKDKDKYRKREHRLSKRDKS